MSPQVVAAVIAASVSVLTLIGTLAAQYFGRRATSRDTQKALEEQGKQLDRTLAEQRTRTLNERFATAASQLGSDKPSAVRLAGVYAMAGLADDWEENRQTCVDVLCAYLRMPYEPDPGSEAPEPERLAFQASREVRHTIIRVITAHLKDGLAVSWQGLNFDFTGVIFDGGDFTDAVFTDGTVSFRDTKFTGGTVSFDRAKFTGGTVNFFKTEFTGGEVSFGGAEFTGGRVIFVMAAFTDGKVSFDGAEFTGGEVDFTRARFNPGASVSFRLAGFAGGLVSFNGAEFIGGRVSFLAAEFTSGELDFGGAEFTGSTVNFGNARFTGGEVDLSMAVFSGGEVDFGGAADWTHRPKFGWDGAPPSGVKLPANPAPPA